MLLISRVLLLLLLAIPANGSTEPFKLGTFEYDGRELLGVVLRDQHVIDLVIANTSMERHEPLWVKLPMPTDMKELIGRYEIGLRDRIHAIVDAVVPTIDSSRKLSYVYDLSELHIFPPVKPNVVLSAALNYREHMTEMTTGLAAEMSDAKAVDGAPQSMDHFWKREASDTRQNPYLFNKPASIVIGDGDPILLKPKREQIDWECEFAIVIGQPASHLPLEEARQHIFGYTMMNDVGDREGRGDNRYGSDWLVWKGSDTFAPLGPFIVPAEFVENPHSLDIQFRLSGELMQDANTELMQHSVDELVQFVSNNIILQPGDVIATGTPGGVGYARTPPVFMEPGDVAECSVEGIGTLSNPVMRWEDVMPR
ncbi:MAG: hypothetical protein CMP01_00100 [Woeseiaceae bacterium]|jgi:2-keto-4-pentenoate hydratase/2-oxohepta-3-ene-1,7-dioic acid hydratase in catechol pathway|nr:hypothetical protein [Woeseiaceae bacterium]